MKFLKKNYFLRKILKSNRYYKKAENNFFFDNLILDIINTNYFKKYGILEHMFFKDINYDVNLIIKQYISAHLFFENKNFGKSILFFFGIKKSLVYFFPIQLIKNLKKNYKINIIASLFLFKFFEIKQFFKGFYFFFYIIFKSSIRIFKKQNNKKRYLYFCNASEKMLPKRDNGFDMITSVIKNENLFLNDFDIFHDLKINKNKFYNVEYKDIFILDQFKKIILFFVSGLKLISISILGIFSKKWYFSILLTEVLKKKIVELNHEQLASKYFFNFTYYIYRPLWTYTAESYNSKISMIFQATNFDQNNITPKNYLCLMNWPEYYLFNESQKKYFQNKLNFKSKIKIQKYIDFNDGNKKLKKKYDLVIFDDPPYRELFSSIFLKNRDHWNIEGCYNFIKDIHDICKKLEIKACIKQKKKSDHMVSRKYTKFINQISQLIDLIDPDFSPREVIENSKLVISFPYSTTNSLAENLNKKNTFYYPGKLTNKWLFDDGKKVITDKKDLENWLKTNF